MKLVLFQTAPGAEILPGVLTERGVVDISPAVAKSYTPQLTMQGIIDGFERLRPALGKARQRKRGGAARARAAAAAIAAAGQNSRLHRQLLGTRAARCPPAQHVHEEPRCRGRAGRHDRAARVHRAVDLHARGRTGAGDQGSGQDGEGQGLAERRVRLYRDDRRLGARAGPQDLAGLAADQLARQIVRYVRADRPLHRHGGRDRGPQRSDRALLE